VAVAVAVNAGHLQNIASAVAVIDFYITSKTTEKT
jgi:hypothetical protein